MVLLSTLVEYLIKAAYFPTGIGATGGAKRAEAICTHQIDVRQEKTIFISS